MENRCVVVGNQCVGIRFKSVGLMFICVGIRVHGHESRGMDASNELVKPQFYMMFLEQEKGNECVGRLDGDAQQ